MLESEILAPYESDTLKCKKFTGSMCALQNLNNNNYDDKNCDIDTFRENATYMKNDICSGENHANGRFGPTIELEYNEEEEDNSIEKNEMKGKNFDKRFWWKSKFIKSKQSETENISIDKLSNNNSRSRSYSPLNNIHKSNIYDNSEFTNKNIFLEQVRMYFQFFFIILFFYSRKYFKPFHFIFKA